MRTRRLVWALGIALLGSSAARGNVIVVNTTADAPDPLPGACELRHAILAANADTSVAGCGPGSGEDTIVFALGDGNPEIDVFPLIPLPAITATVTLDGGTGGATRVVIHGPGSALAGPGLMIAASAPRTAIRNLVINGFDGNGIEIAADLVSLAGNYIGTDASGTLPRANAGAGVLTGGAGVKIGGSLGTTPGGSCTGECNLISGNAGQGILVRATGAAIAGNFIGMNAAGSQPIPNGSSGIAVVQTSYAVIGGSAPAARNLVSGNAGDGVTLDSSNGNKLQGNYIGTTTSGTDGGSTPSKNAQNGVLITNASGGGSPTSNTIGGISVANANLIAFNGGDGVQVFGATSLGNEITFNSIHDNAGKGIHGVSGGNATTLPPIILRADTRIEGSASCGPCEIDVYADADDEGESYLGSTVTAGNWTLDVPATGPHITATATDFLGGTTSEFSAPFSCSDLDHNGLCDGADDDDGDGLVNARDNCPFFASANQSDVDANGRGDVCECGDQDGNGRVNVADLVAINLAIFDPRLATPLCDANGDDRCNVADIVAANRTIFVPKTSICARQPIPGP